MPRGSTEAHLAKNFPEMFRYMKPYNRTTAIEGVRGVKEQWVNTLPGDVVVNVV